MRRVEISYTCSYFLTVSLNKSLKSNEIVSQNQTKLKHSGYKELVLMVKHYTS
jgi:hypothetical protein